jgi:hypothetical protein
MRLAICGVKGIGKTKLVDSFLKNWNTYEKSDYSKVEKIIATKDLNDLEVQREILDAMTDVAMNHTKSANVLHDSCTIDALCNAFYCAAKNTEMKQSDIDLFIQRVIMLAKQSLHFYDIVFYLPFNTKYKESAKPEDQVKLDEIDNFYMALQDTYKKNIDWVFPFKDPDGSPPMIEIFGNDAERLELMKLYVNPDGLAYSKEESLLNV